LDEARMSRQSRLPEVGERGQALLAATEVAVSRTDGVEVERAYLLGAGCQVVDSPEPTPAFAHSDLFRFGASREVGAGAWRALRQIRGVLGLD
jgi:hypothetical protein